MNRRQFVAHTAGLVSALAVAGRAQSRPGAAVVIGVDKAGGLPILRGAASGAEDFAAWLRDEDFDVTLLTDAKAPVEFTAVYKAVEGYVEQADLVQLVVYFAGHGFISKFSEYWLLSGAPKDPNAAINLIGSVDRARLCGLRSVSFVSDACRSRADSLGVELVMGGTLFPSPDTVPQRATWVDLFLGSMLGSPAFERPVDVTARQYEGIYTSAFLSAFTHATDEMIKTVDGVRVVPNRYLEDYLAVEVPRRAASTNAALNQVPDTRVLSRDDVYIGRVNRNPPLNQLPIDPDRVPPPPPPPPPPIGQPEPTLIDLADLVIRTGQLPVITDDRSGAIQRLAQQSGYVAASSAVNRSKCPECQPTAPIWLKGLSSSTPPDSGLTVTGSRVVRVSVHPQVAVDALDSQSYALRLYGARAASVGIQFEGGTGTVIAALSDYVANVVVDDGRVVDVSYIPATGTVTPQEYKDLSERIDSLHAAIASAARLGAFRISGSEEERERNARELASRIQSPRGIDPTLGIYAAYAYADAGLTPHLSDLRGSMRINLGVDLFDILLLSRRSAGPVPQMADDVFPFCPMLSKGWTLLEAKRVNLDRLLEVARRDLLESLWTTFGPDGIGAVSNGLQARVLR